MLDPDKVLVEVNGLKKDREAWATGMDYQDKTTSQFIDDMKSKYSYIADNAKTLFTKCIDGELEDDKFKMMIDMMRQVIDKKKTLFNASHDIGTSLTDEYVKPLVKDKEPKGKQ